ncbi:MAG: TlyA family RNA methyltransferase [Bauldia sp.]
METRLRLDQALVVRGLYQTRSRARDAILRGTVRVDGAIEQRPGQMVPYAAVIAVDDPAAAYVSRSALKLAAAMDHFGLSATSAVALDIGASTGGFTQVLLERGASRVYAIDVGHAQLHPRVASDPRVSRLDDTNARDLTPTLVPEPIDAIVADVSFISLRLALPPALALAAPRAWLVGLIKPQFEVGREGVGKGGIVRDQELAHATASAIAEWLAGLPDWTVSGLLPSPIVGGDGNLEYLVGARRD